MKPHTTIRKMRIHPKDKLDLDKTPNCIYEIPCNTCNLTYVGETKRHFGTRRNEHKREAEKASEQIYTRAERKTSETEFNKSAIITDHVARANNFNWLGGCNHPGERDQPKGQMDS